ncbi:MAG: DUF2254 domain-containing protein [Ilumatobacter sp.]|nr:DUF2254 domain-containing protein [Ilumatobacter sp.]
MLVRLKKIQEDLRSSLFFVPMLFVVGGAAFAVLMLYIDDRVDSLPSRLTATVDSSRGVLTVVASATLSFAGIAFSISLLLISLASSQYSPRVVHGLFRDPFSKRVMGVVIGTFTYCLVVMRAVRGPLEDSGSPVVPSIATLVAVVLGVISILAIIAFISHSAHSMDVSKILHRVTHQTIKRTRETWPDPVDDEDDDDDDGDDGSEWSEPSGDGCSIVFDDHGWVQQVDYPTLFELLEEGATLRLDTAPGRYAIPNTPLCTIWPAPDDIDAATREARAAIIVGQTRTTQQDAAYGVRQLADVALKALSPGVNDPTTAQDAVFHLAAVVREMLVRRPPDRGRSGDDGRRLLLPQLVTHREVIDVAFDEIRLAAAALPTVQIYLLEIFHLLSLSLDDDAPAREALNEHAAMILESSDAASIPGRDGSRVRDAYEHRFGT